MEAIKRQVDLISEQLTKCRINSPIKGTVLETYLENGSITMADYIQDLNAETTARLMLETRKIQLNEARIKLENIRGNQ